MSTHQVWRGGGITKTQPFLFPLSGVCKNTPRFLGADCCGTLKWTVVNSFYRITSRPVKLCVALSRLVTILVWVPVASDEVCCLFPYLARSGNLCTTFDQPFRAKNNSHAHRAGKCAKHFLLLETSAGQNLSCSFSPRLFYSPSPPFWRSSLFLSSWFPRLFLYLHFFFFLVFQGLLTPQPMTRC